MDIYAASEKPIEGVTAESLVERIRQFGHRGAEYVGTHRSRRGGAAGCGAGRRPGADAGRRQRLAGRRQSAGETARRRPRLMARETKKTARQPASAGGCWLGIALCWRRVRLHRHGRRSRCSSYVLDRPAVHALARSQGRAHHRGRALRLARQGAARLRARISTAASSPFRWTSAAAGCWPSTGWKTPRSRASGRTAWWCAFANASRWPSCCLPRRGVLLIDAQGVLLEPPPQAQFAFPVLSGVREERDAKPSAASACAPCCVCRKTWATWRRMFPR